MFSKQKKIEDIVIESLIAGPIETSVLIEKVRASRKNTTKQGIYKILKKLHKDEVIIHKTKHVSLSSVWLNKVSNLLDTARLNYQDSISPANNFLRLKPGEKVSYTFNSFESTDIFWAHAFDIFSEMSPSHTPVLIYNPHEWFLLVRPESENLIFEHLNKLNRKLFLIAGEKTELDIFVSKYFDGKLSEYMPSSKKLFQKENYYVNVFGDFLIEVFLDQKISKEVDNFYARTKTLTDESKKELTEIIKLVGKNKLIITKNKRKADEIRRMFKKYFLIK